MDAIWERIERWLGANAPAVLASLNPPATPEQIAAAERHLGVTFPDDVRATYLRHDGQTPTGPGLFGGWEWMPLGEVVGHWDLWTELHDGGEFDGFTGDPGGRVVADWWHRAWVPLTHNGAGDSHCVDLHPGPAGTPGQVIVMYHDYERRPVKATSFRVWLATFADELEAGGYVVSDHGGLVRRHDS